MGMTDEEIRRVRRIIAGPDTPPQPPVVEPRQAERFQRVLGAARRPLATAAGTTAPPEPQSSSAWPTFASPAADGAASSGKSSGRSSGVGTKAPRGDVAPKRSFRDPVSGVDAVRERQDDLLEEPRSMRPARPAGLASAATQDLSGGSVTPPPIPFRPQVVWNELPEGWEDALADVVARLCRASDPAFHSWTVQVPLDPEALPETELRLTFSPHHLRLRFSTASTVSLAVVSAHQDHLSALLREAMPEARHIDIDIT